MSEDEILTHFDYIFGTNTINHIKLKMPLLKSLLERLEEDFRKPSPQYEKLRKEQIKVSEKLYKNFDDGQKEMFEHHNRISNQMAAVEDLQLFCFGYIIAKELEREEKIEQE